MKHRKAKMEAQKAKMEAQKAKMKPQKAKMKPQKAKMKPQKENEAAEGQNERQIFGTPVEGVGGGGLGYCPSLGRTKKYCLACRENDAWASFSVL